MKPKTANSRQSRIRHIGKTAYWAQPTQCTYVRDDAVKSSKCSCATDSQPNRAHTTKVIEQLQKEVWSICTSLEQRLYKNVKQLQMMTHFIDITGESVKREESELLYSYETLYFQVLVMPILF